jgi:hypothetical protein
MIAVFLRRVSAHFLNPLLLGFFERKRSAGKKLTTFETKYSALTSAKHNTVYCKDMYVKYGQEVDSLGKLSLILIVILGAKLLEWTWKRRKR